MAEDAKVVNLVSVFAEQAGEPWREGLPDPESFKRDLEALKDNPKAASMFRLLSTLYGKHRLVDVTSFQNTLRGCQSAVRDLHQKATAALTAIEQQVPAMLQSVVDKATATVGQNMEQAKRSWAQTVGAPQAQATQANEADDGTQRPRMEVPAVRQVPVERRRIRLEVDRGGEGQGMGKKLPDTRVGAGDVAKKLLETMGIPGEHLYNCHIQEAHNGAPLALVMSVSAAAAHDLVQASYKGDNRLAGWRVRRHLTQVQKGNRDKIWSVHAAKLKKAKEDGEWLTWASDYSWCRLKSGEVIKVPADGGAVGGGQAEGGQAGGGA
jgi:hypothetical protein